MKNFILQKCIFLIVALLLPMLVEAAPAWHITTKSSLTFIAKQNNSPVRGKFNSFTGDIHFDPAQLGSSYVKIFVDINSMQAAYLRIVDTLRTPDWFYAAQFPRAVFKASHFSKTGNNSYKANGTLTIRDKTIPIVLNFVLEQYTATTAVASGSTVLKRTQFGVGQGDWANTDTVKDDVVVNFTVVATKK